MNIERNVKGQGLSQIYWKSGYIKHDHMLCITHMEGRSGGEPALATEGSRSLGVHVVRAHRVCACLCAGVRSHRISADKQAMNLD